MGEFGKNIMNLQIVLNFFKKNRKICFLLLLLLYGMGLLVPDKLKESCYMIQVLMIIGIFSPIILYNFIGWKDDSRDPQKRNFSRFSFFFLLFIILGNILAIIFEARL